MLGAYERTREKVTQRAGRGELCRRHACVRARTGRASARPLAVGQLAAEAHPVAPLRRVVSPAHPAVVAAGDAAAGARAVRLLAREAQAVAADVLVEAVADAAVVNHCGFGGRKQAQKRETGDSFQRTRKAKRWEPDAQQRHSRGIARDSTAPAAPPHTPRQSLCTPLKHVPSHPLSALFPPQTPARGGGEGTREPTDRGGGERVKSGRSPGDAQHTKRSSCAV